MSNVKTIAVVGVGTMGRGIIQCIASAGYEVNCYDVNETELNRLITYIDAMQQDLVKADILTSIAAKESLQKI